MIVFIEYRLNRFCIVKQNLDFFRLNLLSTILQWHLTIMEYVIIPANDSRHSQNQCPDKGAIDQNVTYLH